MILNILRLNLYRHYLQMEIMDYATPVQDPIRKRFICRHRLNKKDPGASVSDPVEPIVYYLDSGTPEPIRSALLEGARWWNQAFEAAGYRNAFRVEMLPPDADPMDVRYNVIEWIHRATRGYSYGNVVADPRTGEIIKGHEGLGGGDRQLMKRTERDMPIIVVLVGTALITIFIWLFPTFRMNLLGAILIVTFGFLFSVVSARITGIVGSSSSPLSGMTIAVLMATCLLFLAFGMKGKEFTYLALVIGAVICIAISNAGTTAQDLKTGFLVGATPRAQQIGLFLGVITSASVVGYTMLALNASQTKEIAVTPFTPPAVSMQYAETIKGKEDGKTYTLAKVVDVPGVEPGNYLIDQNTHLAVKKRVDGIGGRELAAPQANLMAAKVVTPFVR